MRPSHTHQVHRQADPEFVPLLEDHTDVVHSSNAITSKHPPPRPHVAQVYRQADPEFVSLLEDVRWGRNSAKALQTLVAKCARPLATRNSVKPTVL